MTFERVGVVLVSLSGRHRLSGLRIGRKDAVEELPYNMSSMPDPEERCVCDDGRICDDGRDEYACGDGVCL